jgi:Flp pilus assembly protein TadD
VFALRLDISANNLFICAALAAPRGLMNVANLLARFFYGITEPIMAPIRWVQEEFQESPRKRALIYGLPAILIACGGIALIVAAQIRREKELLEFYNQATNKLEKDISKQVTLLNTSRQLTSDSGAKSGDASGNTSGGRGSEGTKSGGDSAAKDKPAEEDPLLAGLSEEQKAIVKELRTLQGDQQTLLLKLISLDPVNQSYRYRYADSFAATDPMKQFELMRQLAPETNPGYADAHFWLAANFMRARVNTPNERRLFLEKALIHANFCLNLEADRREARMIKANALYGLGRQQEAYTEFEELFRAEPEYFDTLVRINKLMRMESRNRSIYEDAATRLSAKLKAVRDTDIDAWNRTLRQIQLCFIGSQNFVDLRNTLLNEQTLARDNAIKKKAVDEIFGNSLNAEAQVIVRSANVRERLPELLKLLADAYKLSPEDVQVKYQIAYVSMAFPEIAAEAKAIYDPESDVDVPGQVLQVLGNAEMQNRNYSQAIQRYEQARLKTPKDADLLNNLAFAYLTSDNQNAERALFLVDEALQLLPPVLENNDPLSHFHHTRGSALLALNRVTEAAASFELALQYRPDNPGILESLVKCYAGRDEKQAAAYQKRLDAALLKAGQKRP